MIATVNPYNIPKNNDTCIAICFFRPIEYSKPVENLFIFLNDLSVSQIPVYSIELLYHNQKSTIPNPTKTVASNSVIFSKENLWNIVERHIPDQYTKIIFLDTDVRFTNPDWFNLCSETLNQYKVIQPIDYCYRDVYGLSNNYQINEQILRPSIAKGIAEKETINISYHYPGFGIGIDRNFFHSIGGICDYGLNGYGDSLFWGCFDKFSSKYITIASKKFPQYTQYQSVISNIIEQKNNIVSFIPDNIALHLYHGSQKNRRYASRDNYIPNSYNLFYNQDGVLEIESDHDLIQYWVDRKEDD